MNKMKFRAMSLIASTLSDEFYSLSAIEMCIPEKYFFISTVYR